MRNISTGAGLVVLGLGIALHPLVSGLVAQATAAPWSSSSAAAAAVTSAATAQAGPTVVWMGVTSQQLSGGLSSTTTWTYHRLWSDGRLEIRDVAYTSSYVSSCGRSFLVPDSCMPLQSWREVSPPPGGNGFACRTDINGDRVVDGSDLSFLLNAWGQQGACAPDATYPSLGLGDLAHGAAIQ
jgi:hypothetical protein